MSDTFLHYLLETPMKFEFHQPCFKQLLTVNASDNLSLAFRRLSTENFSSAPVLDKGKFIGFITMYDITKFVTNLFWGSTEKAWIDFWEKEEAFLTASVTDVMETSMWRGQQTGESVYEQNSTLHALEHLVLGKAHRIAVLNNDVEKKLVNIFTQSMMISEIAQRVDTLPWAVRNRKVSQISTLWENVISIPEHEVTIEAFNKMRNHNVHGLAIVNDDGVLVGNISVRDLRGVGTDGSNFAKLFEDVKSYKSWVTSKYARLGPRTHDWQGITPLSALLVAPSDTFRTLLHKMKDGSIHRVYMCSASSIKQGNPIVTKVITQTTVLSHIFKSLTMPNYQSSPAI